MSYKLLEHATDAFVEVTAPSLEAAFIQAGIAAVEITLDRSKVEEKSKRNIICSGKNLKHLLYNWLEEVIFNLITEGFAISRFELEIKKNSGYEIKSILFGEELDIKKHQFKVEIKAPTFHLMEIEEASNVKMRFLMDL